LPTSRPITARNCARQAFLAGGGTLAGLRVTHQAATTGEHAVPEEIRVEPGLAVDRLGRLIELPRPACLRLPRWYDAQNAIDGGDTLRRSAYADLGRFLSERRLRRPLPYRIARSWRTSSCASSPGPRGLTPSFAAGPFDALKCRQHIARARCLRIAAHPARGIARRARWKASLLWLASAPGAAVGWQSPTRTPPRATTRAECGARRVSRQRALR